jgi:hypothetical protein
MPPPNTIGGIGCDSENPEIIVVMLSDRRNARLGSFVRNKDAPNTPEYCWQVNKIYQRRVPNIPLGYQASLAGERQIAAATPQSLVLITE